MDPSSEGRAERASRALSEYDQDDMAADITDLLADLRHLCAELGLEVDFAACVETSEMHFIVESHFNAEQEEED